MTFSVWLLVCFCGLTLGQNVLPQTEVATEIESCFPDMCKFLKEFGAMKAKLETVETNLKEKSEALETKLKEKSEALETKLKQTKSQILVLKEKAKPLKVVFSVGLPGDAAIGPVNLPTTLVYKRVITNVGNAYNQLTGIFVAPVRGMYYFSFFYHAGGERAVNLFLMKNHEYILASSDHMTLLDGADNGGNAAFLELQQGDQVYVQLEANTHVWGNSYTTTFSGFLLYQI